MEELKKMMDDLKQREELLLRILASTERPKRYWGLEPRDIIHYAILLVAFICSAAIGFQTLKDVSTQTKWLIEYASNSDSYHGATTGYPFKQGMPQDWNMRRDVTPVQYNRNKEISR